jgi:thiamine-phosphate diphosphorylase / hydroxyethylthiazole kinase
LQISPLHFLGCVVVLTGPTDFISDGKAVVELNNGDKLLGQITGSGCIAGSAIASYCAVAASASDAEQSCLGTMVPGDMLVPAVAGVLVLTIAAEVAIKRFNIHGPGSFLSGLIDSISDLTPEDVRKYARLKMYQAL